MADKTESILEKFHLAARAAKLEYYLIGGFAASFWGKPRFTADIDYVISRECFELAQDVINRLGFQLKFLHPSKSFAHFERPELQGFRIDLMLVDDATWRKLRKEALLADFKGSEAYPIVSASHLIAMKLHAAKQPDRQDKIKDLSDVAEILISQKISLDNLSEAGILGEHGSERTLKLLREILDDKDPKK